MKEDSYISEIINVMVNLSKSDKVCAETRVEAARAAISGYDSLLSSKTSKSFEKVATKLSERLDNEDKPEWEK